MMIRRIPTLAAALFLLAACSRPAVNAPAGASPSPAPSGDLYGKGRVESFTHSATASRLVVGPAMPEGCGIAAVVDARTRYLQRGAAGLQPSERSAVSVGDSVEVYVTGPVTRSCPAQGFASTIVLLARP